MSPTGTWQTQHLHPGHRVHSISPQTREAFLHLAERQNVTCLLFSPLLFFFLPLIPCGHNTIKAGLMDCCGDACLCGRFSHLWKKKSEALSSWSPYLPTLACCLVTVFYKAANSWKPYRLLTSNVSQRRSFSELSIPYRMYPRGLWMWPQMDTCKQQQKISLLKLVHSNKITVIRGGDLKHFKQTEIDISLH